MIKQFTTTFATRVVVAVAGIVSSIITARVLGPEGRGEYFYVITLSQLAVQFGHLGLASTNTYIIVQSPEKLRILAANSLWVSGILGLGVAITFFFIEMGIGNFERLILCLVLPVLAPSQLYFLLASNILIGLGRASLYNIVLLVSTIMQLGAVFVVSFLGGFTAEMLWVSAVAALLTAVILWLILKSLGATQLSPNFALLREHFGFSLRVYIATLIPFFVARLNIIVIDTWSDSAELGSYSVAVQLFDTLLIIPSTVALLLFPKLVRNNQSTRFASMIRVAIVTFLVMFAVGCSAGIIAPYAFPIMFGEEFLSASEIFWVMIPGLISFSVVNVISQYLASEGFPALNLIAWVVSIPLLTISSIYLVPDFGAIGGGKALSLTYFILMIALIGVSIRQKMVSKNLSNVNQ